MRFTVLKKGETLGDLAARLSRAEAAPEAIAALESANPRLSVGPTEKALADTLVFVPGSIESEGPQADPEEGTPITSVLDSLLSRVGEALESVTTSLEREERRADEAVARLESKEFRELAKAQPVLERRSPDLKSAAKARLDRAKAAREAETTISDRILEDLSSLRSAVLERSAVAGAVSGLRVSPEPRGGRRPPGGRSPRDAGTTTTETVSTRKSAAKKRTSKKGATSKAAKKSTTKKTATKKRTAKKAPTKKGATKKSTSRRPTTKKSSAKKATGGRGQGDNDES